MNTPALDIFEARKTAASATPGAFRSGLAAAWKEKPADVLMAGSNAAMAGAQVAAPLVANMTAPGAPSRGHNQTGTMMPMPSN